MKDIQQLIKKNSQEGRYEDIFPKTFLDAVIDKESGTTLTDILSSFNMYFLSYTGSRETTRLEVPMSLRKQGLWITYVLYDGNTITEWYGINAVDDASWQDGNNWRLGSNMLVGDISISAGGNWIINGVDTGIPARGEKGDSAMLRVNDSNKLQVSYTNGNVWIDLSDNPVYTQFRVNNNKLEQSIDLGETWSVVSDYIAAWFRFTGTIGSSQANNVGKIQISRDNGAIWSDLSGEFTNSLHIKGYVATVDALPSTAVQGDIYGVGPTYDPSDTEHTNPIYQLYVKDSTGWVNNGRFTSISAGVVQDFGDSETEVMSQKAVSDNLGKIIDSDEYVRVYTDSNDKVLFGIKVDGTVDWAVGVPSAIKEVLLTKVDKVENKSLIDSEVANSLNYSESPEYIQIDTDSNNNILGGYNAETGKRIYPTQQMYDTIDDAENRLEITIDASEKIIDYKDAKGKNYLAFPSNQDDILQKQIDIIKSDLPSCDGNVRHLEFNKLCSGWNTVLNYYQQDTIITRNKGVDEWGNEFQKDQCIAIYNNLLFEFKDALASKIAIFDLNTNEQIASGVLSGIGGAAETHNNSASFTNTFYDDNDEFPLLLLSLCQRTGGDGCMVFRVARASGTSFTFTYIKTISQNIVNTSLIDFPSWVYNDVTNELVAVREVNANYDTYIPEMKAWIDFYTFKCPDLKSGGNITLTTNDVIATKRFPYTISQSGTCFNGKLYFACQAPNTNGNNPWWEDLGITSGTSMVCIVDIPSGTIEQMIVVTTTDEIEGVAIHNNAIYTSSRRGWVAEGQVTFIVRKLIQL